MLNFRRIVRIVSLTSISLPVVTSFFVIYFKDVMHILYVLAKITPQ